MTFIQILERKNNAERGIWTLLYVVEVPELVKSFQRHREDMRERMGSRPEEKRLSW